MEVEGTADQASNMNAEEMLLDQPKWEAPRIAQLQKEMQPYLDLWMCAISFAVRLLPCYGFQLNLAGETEYAGQGALLMKELEGAVERASNRNAEEVLLKQPKSEAPRIAQLQELQLNLGLWVCPDCF
jgi:hypothetical protein